MGSLAPHTACMAPLKVPGVPAVFPGSRWSWESPKPGVVDAFRLYAMDEAYEARLDEGGAAIAPAPTLLCVGNRYGWRSMAVENPRQSAWRMFLLDESGTVALDHRRPPSVGTRYAKAARV